MYKTEVNATVYVCVCACVNIKIIIQISMLMFSGKSFSISEPFPFPLKLEDWTTWSIKSLSTINSNHFCQTGKLYWLFFSKFFAVHLFHLHRQMHNQRFFFFFPKKLGFLLYGSFLVLKNWDFSSYPPHLILFFLTSLEEPMLGPYFEVIYL